MHSLAELTDLVNDALTEQREAQGLSASHERRIVLREPLDDAEAAAHGPGTSVACWLGHEGHALSAPYLRDVLNRMHRAFVHRERRAVLEEIRRRALTVLTPEEFRILQGDGRP